MNVNGQDLNIKTGQTILEACESHGIEIPTLCHIKELLPSGACRMCVVEVEGAHNLVPSCSFPAGEGMVIRTHSERALQARKTIIELLQTNHPDDCLYCVRSGSCDLQSLSQDYGVRERRFANNAPEQHLDVSSPSLERDPAKCILCGKCVRTCEEIMGIAAIDFAGRGSNATVCPPFNAGLNVSNCIACGQCVTACPTGALRESSSLKQVMSALKDPNKTVVVQHAPAVSVSLAEEFGLKPGIDVNGIMVTALRRLGFSFVFDTSFSADVTIMEEASELVHRVTNKGPLPMFTSCSPGWIKYMEQSHPDMLGHLSSCKSPQQMMGALVKNIFAKEQGIDAKEIYSVSVMPCTAKKFEAQRPEMGNGVGPDIDAVLTTRELARLIRAHGIAFDKLKPEVADTPFGERSGAGKIFGSTGGVMEAALRTAHHMITGNELDDLSLKAVRGFDGVREAKIDVGGLEVGVAVVSGVKHADALIQQIKEGRDDLHFIEVMTCPGGCINGGGQPIHHDPARVKARAAALYKIDEGAPVRVSHENPHVKALYEEHLGEPLGERSHHLLHTSYEKRELSY